MKYQISEIINCLYYFINIMKKQENRQDQFQFQQFQKDIKQKLFETVKNYLQHCQNLNPILIYLLILIQSLQILWFSIHPLLKFLDNQLMLDYLRIILSYLNFQDVLKKNGNLMMPIVLICTSVILVHVATIIISIYLTNIKKKKTQFANVINKITAIQIVLINTILTIPIYNASIITLYCDPESYYYNDGHQQCYDTTHIILSLLSAINLLVLLSESLIYWFLFYVRNPYSKNYYALSNNLFRLAKILIKLLPPIYFIIQFKYKVLNVYIFVFLVLILGYIAVLRISSIHNFSQNFFYFQLFTQSVILWFCINTVICYQIPSSGMNFIQSCIVSLIFAYTVCCIEGALTKSFFINNINGNLKKQDRQKFIYLLINTLFKEISTQQVNPIVYIKLINSSLNICNIKIYRYLYKNDLKTQQIVQLARQLIMVLLSRYIQQGPNINLQLIRCRILFDSGLKIICLHEIGEIRSEKLSMYQEFMIYNFKATHKMFDDNQIKSSQQNMSQINNYLQFIQLMNQFQSQLEICAQNNEQFWQQLCEDIPSVSKIFNLAKRSISYTKKIQLTFRKIQSIFPQNITSLKMYYQFLNHVCVRYKQYNKIKQKLNIEKQRETLKGASDAQKNERIRFRPNDKMCVLQISTNLSSIGLIINCNSEVKRYLGYDKSQLINQKVTKIMPKVYSQIHDCFIKDYLQKADSMKLPVQKNVYAFKKNIRIIETCLTVKIFPNVMVGFQLVGFFKQKNSHQNYKKIIVNMKTLQIEGMSQGFIQMVGNRIKLSQIQKEPLRLSQIFPQIQPNHNFSLNEQIRTVFRFSDCTDKLIDIDQASEQIRKKSQKKVVLQLINLKIYNYVQIGVFNIQIQQSGTILSLHDTDNQIKFSRAKVSQKLNPIDYQKFTKQNRQISQANIQEQTSLQRKIQDFVGSQSHLSSICIIKIIFSIIFVSLLVTSTVMSFYQTFSNSTYQNVLQEINISSNITINQGKLLILNSNLGQNAQNKQFWETNRVYMQTILKIIQNQMVYLFEKANIRKPEPLVINQFRRYQFKSIFKNNTFTETTNLFYLDGIIQIVFVGLNYLSRNYSQFYPAIDHEIYQSMYFIQQNTKKMLPEISTKTTQSYANLLSDGLLNQFYKDIYFISGKITVFITIFIITVLLLKKFNEFNFTLVKILNNILKWDAYQLYSKCRKFRNKVFDKNPQQSQQVQKNFDLLKVFPKGIIANLSQGKFKRKSSGSNNSSKKISILKNLDKNELGGSQQGQMQILKKSFHNQFISNKGDLINISFQNSLSKKIICVFAMLMLLVSAHFGFLLAKKSVSEQFLIQKSNIANLSSYTKSFLFTYFYGSRITKGFDQYGDLYEQQLKNFYSASQKVSHLIGDPVDYLRIVYRDIQTLNSIVKKAIVKENPEQIKSIVNKIEVELLEISNQINYFLNNYYNNSVQKFKQSRKIAGILKIILEIVLTLLFLRLTQLYLIKSVENQLEHSCDIIKMLPIWVICKSQSIKTIMFKQDYNIKSRNIQNKNQAVPEESASDLFDHFKSSKVRQKK